MSSTHDTSTSSTVRLSVALLGLLLLCSSECATAFTAPSTSTSRASKICNRRTNKGFVLGPVARNGLAYEDTTLGDGRRILPGDTVYCYYVGSFATTSAPQGPFGGLMGGGGATKQTVFDSVSKCVCKRP